MWCSASPILAAAEPSTRARSGCIVEDETSDALYFRGVEERQHHSLVLTKGNAAEAQHIGFKVGSEEDLDKAAQFFKGKGLRHAFVERPYQGRTLQAVDPFGVPLELYFAMEKRERLLQQYGRYKGVQAQRLDHFNVFAPDVQGATDFYASLGFRLTEYAEEDGAGGPHRRLMAAPQGQRARHRLHQRPRARVCTTSPTGRRRR